MQCEAQRRTGKQGEETPVQEAAASARRCIKKTEHAGSSSKHVLQRSLIIFGRNQRSPSARDHCLGHSFTFEARPNGQVPAAALPRPGTYPSLVRRSRYVLSTGRSSDLASSPGTIFSAFANDMPVLRSTSQQRSCRRIPLRSLFSRKSPIGGPLGTCEYPVIPFSKVL